MATPLTMIVVPLTNPQAPSTDAVAPATKGGLQWLQPLRSPGRFGARLVSAAANCSKPSGAEAKRLYDVGGGFAQRHRVVDRPRMTHVFAEWRG
jgi:hypothetical protein